MQENVPQFDPSILDGVLGHIYHHESSVLDPFDYGWPVARRRRYSVLRHRCKTGAAASPLNEMSRLFLRDQFKSNHSDEHAPAWDIFFVAGCSELRGELLWAASRPQTMWTGDMSPEALNPMNMDTFMQTLTDTEQTFLQEYRSLPDSIGQVYQLNQNPSVTATMSLQHRMVTLIKNAGILWYLASMISSHALMHARCSC